MATNMAHLGGVINKAGQFVAKVETKDSDTRFKMEGPARDDEQKAAQDLSSIRAAADGQATRSGGLRAMRWRSPQHMPRASGTIFIEA